MDILNTKLIDWAEPIYMNIQQNVLSNIQNHKKDRLSFFVSSWLYKK